MRKCLIYGNCQADALKFHLKRIKPFTREFEIIEIKAVHLLNQNDVPYLLDQIQKTDLFVHQPISDNYKNIKELGSNYLKSMLKEECQVLSFPSIYFKGYNPEMIGLKDLDNKGLLGPFTYYDINLLKAVYEGNTTIGSLKDLVLNPDFYTVDEAQSSFQNSLAELSSRENANNIDLTVTDIIENNYQKEKLFHVFNHPSSLIIFQLVDKIISSSINETIRYSNAPDTLSRISYPVYTSIFKHLGFEFDNKLHYKIVQSYLNAEEYLSTLIEFIFENQAIIKYNLERNTQV